jgi:hypothetical protein
MPQRGFDQPTADAFCLRHITLPPWSKYALPARIFVCVPEWPGPFDIEIDCVAVI